MRVLLDTNAYVALASGHAAVTQRVRRAERVLFSVIVAGELLQGFRQGTRFARNMAELERFLDDPFVLPLHVTLETADRFGMVAAGLRKRGKPIPTNDIWIAAHCLETGAELLTFDRHFEFVQGIAWTLLPTEA